MQMAKLKDVNCAIDQITQLIKLKLLIWSNEMIIWSIAEKGPKQGVMVKEQMIKD